MTCRPPRARVERRPAACAWPRSRCRPSPTPATAAAGRARHSTRCCPPTVPAAVELPRSAARDEVLDVARRHRVPRETAHRRRSRPSCFPSAAELAATLHACVARGVRVQVHRRPAPRRPAHRSRPPGFAHHGFLNVLLAVPTRRPRRHRRRRRALLGDRDAGGLAAALRDLAARPRRRGPGALFTSFGTCSVARAGRRPGRARPAAFPGSDPRVTAIHELARPACRHRVRTRQPALWRVLQSRRRRPRTGVAIGDSVLDLAARHRRRRCTRPARSTRSWPGAGSLGGGCASGSPTGSPTRRTEARSSRTCCPEARSRCTCRSRWPTTSTSTAPSTTPRTSAGCSGRTPRR